VSLDWLTSALYLFASQSLQSAVPELRYPYLPAIQSVQSSGLHGGTAPYFPEGHWAWHAVWAVLANWPEGQLVAS
jgi:hypothetical protein